MKKFLMPVCVALLLVLATIITLNVGSVAIGAPSTSQLSTTPSPMPKQESVGSWTGPDVSTGDYSHAPKGIPSISGQVTQAKISQEIQEHPRYYFTTASNLEATSVQFMTIEQLTSVLPSERVFLLANYPKEKQIAYATVKGDLYGDGEVELMHNGYIIFDAETGNALISTALVNAPAK